MIDLEAIRTRNTQAKILLWEALEREITTIYGGGSPFADIDDLIAEVKRLRQLMPTTSEDGSFASGDVVVTP